MATAVHPAMTMTPFNGQQNQCIDPDQDFFDFTSLSPPPATLKREASVSSSITSPIGTALDDELQQPAKPSHEYERFKQHSGMPVGSIAGLGNYNSGFNTYSSTGLDDMSFMTNDSMLDSSWNTGLNMDSSMSMGMDYDQSNFMFNDSQDDFIDPSAITQEEAPATRVWPGMHQQAALAKAQAQAAAQQQRQQQQQQLALQKQQQAIAQQHNRMQSTSQPARKTSSPLSDARTEETIARVVAQIRADSQNASSGGHDGSSSLLPHVIRTKKEEDDMDEDERLLASEEGKKLSSKERRQLRNKVSARAFRSRRKEYIGQLEGDISSKVNEANELRNQNRLLMEENARSRAFIERLLRHQAFTPFLEELSRDEALQPKGPAATSSTSVAAPAPASFQSQSFGGMSQAENTHVGMTMIPETQFDFSSLNLNNTSNNNSSSWGNGGFGFQPRVFAVLELPEGPSNPLDVEAMTGKADSPVFHEDSPAEVVKADYPVIERPVESKKVTVVASEEVEEDSEYDLYSSSPAPSASAPINHETLFTNPEKALAHISLTVSDEAQEVRLAERLERRIAAMEPVLQRLAAITSTFDL